MIDYWNINMKEVNKVSNENHRRKLIMQIIRLILLLDDKINKDQLNRIVKIINEVKTTSNIDKY